MVFHFLFFVPIMERNGCNIVVDGDDDDELMSGCHQLSIGGRNIVST